MIIRWYEICCDSCGGACQYQGNKRLAEQQYRGDGGLVTKKKNHYCDNACKKKAKQETE